MMLTTVTRNVNRKNEKKNAAVLLWGIVLVKGEGFCYTVLSKKLCGKFFYIRGEQL